MTYVDEPFRKVVAIMPERYEDIWTAAKGFYKTEPAVADGGEVVIYAPHITEVSETHHEIYEIGYHCRDYFVKQWDEFKDVHWGVLAHSTHMRGRGTYDETTGEENLRINVTLATQISAETCGCINVGYCDPATMDLAALESDRRAQRRRDPLPPARLTSASGRRGVSDADRTAQGRWIRVRGVAPGAPWGVHAPWPCLSRARRGAESRSRRAWSAARRRSSGGA